MVHDRPVRFRVLGGIVAVALAVTLAAPAAAARPTREVIDLDDPSAEAEWAEALTDLCGVPVAVDFEGTVTVHRFSDRWGAFRMEIDKYWIRDRFTNLDTGASILLRDVGPDQFRIDRHGRLIVAIIGRSLTGSGVIGRVVIDVATGETLHSAGRPVGLIEEQVCPAIT